LPGKGSRRVASPLLPTSARWDAGFTAAYGKIRLGWLVVGSSASLAASFGCLSRRAAPAIRRFLVLVGERWSPAVFGWGRSIAGAGAHVRTLRVREIGGSAAEAELLVAKQGRSTHAAETRSAAWFTLRAFGIIVRCELAPVSDNRSTVGLKVSSNLAARPFRSPETERAAGPGPTGTDRALAACLAPAADRTRPIMPVRARWLAANVDGPPGFPLSRSKRRCWAADYSVGKGAGATERRTHRSVKRPGPCSDQPAGCPAPGPGPRVRAQPRPCPRPPAGAATPGLAPARPRFYIRPPRDATGGGARHTRLRFPPPSVHHPSVPRPEPEETRRGFEVSTSSDPAP